MRTSATLAAVLAMALCALAQDQKTVNSKCPVKGGEDVKPGIYLNVKGKNIGFCCRSCQRKFESDPLAYLPNVPGFENLKKPEPKKPEPKPEAKPGAKPDPAKPVSNEAPEPCEVKKTVPGYYCVGEKRMLGPDDVRATTGVCKKCEEKPKKIEMCFKIAKIYYQADCHPNKTSDKPVS